MSTLKIRSDDISAIPRGSLRGEGAKLTHLLVDGALALADRAVSPYIGGAKLRCASGAIIPGALSILQGTVPGRVRGSGHMVPTYFRRELRDRALQRPLRLRTFVLLISASNHRFRDLNTNGLSTNSPATFASSVFAGDVRRNRTLHDGKCFERRPARCRAGKARCVER